MSELWGSAKWIWTRESIFNTNQFVSFRRNFEYSGGEIELQITADSRYTVWINGKYVQFGPIRSYPNHYGYDRFSIKNHVVKGENVLVVLVNHFGISTFHYLLQAGGLLFRIFKEDGEVFSDSSCRCRECSEYAVYTPKISCQQEYEEQVDARLYDGWREYEYDDGAWQYAVELRPAEDGIHKEMARRDIPFLTREECYPKKTIALQSVQENRYISFDIGFLLKRDMFCDTPYLLNCGFIIELESEKTQDCNILYKELFRNLIVNGKEAFDRLPLVKGINTLTFYERGIRHATQATLSFSADFAVSVRSLRIVGPFSPQEKDGTYEKSDIGYYKVIDGPHMETDMPVVLASLAVGETDFEQYTSDITHTLHRTNVFAETYRTDGRILPEMPDITQLSGSEGYLIEMNGDARTLLVDFGKELIGFLSFEAEAPAGTVIDFHVFEFIQPNGRKNYAEGMSDTMRYICGGGTERYESIIRRGGRFLYITVRGDEGKVRIGSLKMIYSTYPQARRGEFFSSDYLLNYIYECSRDTLRCCMEDTYSDCPTYEQTYWVGDMRNEALVDWAVNGDARLWKRCLILAGQSLDYSELVLSQVPSGWWNILPAWTMLWMLSVSEYWLYTAEAAGVREMFPFLKRNFEGLRKHVEKNGLLKIYGWNMFDWAPMETPVDGIVAHVNFLACLALKNNAALARDFNETEFGEACEDLYNKISDALNDLLWDDERKAYADCLRQERNVWVRSKVFSQQTQTVALLSGVASGERKKACLRHMLDPKDMVQSGSPFFSFFLLEVLRNENLEAELLATIRMNWGMMTDTGCNTFWEQWGYPSEDGRITRSHCHGWSACPAYFLNEYVLGVRPLVAGYAKTQLSPHGGGELRFARGSIPTPHGEISVQWEYCDGKYRVHCCVPSVVELVVEQGRSDIELALETDKSV